MTPPRLRQVRMQTGDEECSTVTWRKVMFRMPPLVLLPVTRGISPQEGYKRGGVVDPSSEAPKRAGIDRWCPVGGGPCGKASTDGEAVGARAGDVFDEHVLRRHAVVPRALVPDAYTQWLQSSVCRS